MDFQVTIGCFSDFKIQPFHVDNRMANEPFIKLMTDEHLNRGVSNSPRQEGKAVKNFIV